MRYLLRELAGCASEASTESDECRLDSLKGRGESESETDRDLYHGLTLQAMV